MLIGFSFCLRSLKSTVRGLCRGLERFGTETLFLWTERGALFLFGVGALLCGGRLAALAWVFLVVRLADLAAYLATVRRLLGKKPMMPRPPAVRLLTALPFAVSGLMWGLYYQVNTAILSVLSSARDTGLYGAVYRFVDILQVIPRMIIVVAFPAMAVAWVQDKAGFHDMVRRLQRGLTWAALPVLSALILTSGPLLALTFGRDYVEAVPALRLILLGLFFVFHSMLLNQVLATSGHEILMALELFSTVIFNIALNVWLIPLHGFMGAAVATLATEILHASALTFIAWKVNALRSRFTGAQTVVLGGAP